MKQFKILVPVAIGAALCTLPLLASAKSLTIVNSTKQPFSVRVNNLCSSEFGVIKKNSTKTVAEEKLNQLCAQNSSNCEAMIFKSKNCTGNQIGNFMFDTKTGLKNNFKSAKNYSMTLSFALNTVILSEAL